MRWKLQLLLLASTLAASSVSASAMDIVRAGSKLTVTGANFRYVWDTRRGGELVSVEQPGILGGWWTLGMPQAPTSTWQRVNSTFAWKSLDTIPAFSITTKRGAYYSGEWNVAYASADHNASLKIITQSPEELVFETQSNPKILENRRLPIPWQVKQVVKVLDSGVIVIRFELKLPKDETYELDWSMLSVNLDDCLYKEPHPDRQWKCDYQWAFPGDADMASGFSKPVLQDLPHLPLDIDIDVAKSILTEKPLLFGAASYDLTHVVGAAKSGAAEWCLENARSIVDTKDDFGSFLMVRKASGMSPVPTYIGSMRGNPCMSAGWNIFDGKEAKGLNEPLTYNNTLTFAVGMRKHCSMPTAGTDDRNVLLGARVYYAQSKLPTAAEVQAMAAEGCDTLILGPGWRSDEAATTALVKAAHAAGIRVAANVNARDLKSLVTDTTWFSRVFEKDKDGIFLANVSFLANAQAGGGQEDFRLDGDAISFKTDGNFRANAASFALCMRKLRQTVGKAGFLIGEDAAPGPTLLSLAEFDLHVPAKPDAYVFGAADGRMAMRGRCAAGVGLLTDSLKPEYASAAAMNADTPIILWPAKDQRHAAFWQLMKRLPAKGFRVESDLLPAERHFTTSSPEVHGTLFDGGNGKAVLLLAANKPGSANVTLTLPGAKVNDDAGKPMTLTSGTAFNTGEFTVGQIKLFEISAPREPAK